MKNKIKTFEEACEKLQINFNAPSGLSNDEIAYMKIKIIVEALNEGWKPNWNDWNQRKYYPWFKMGTNGAAVPGVGFSYNVYDNGYSYSHVGSRLCFKTAELAEYAGKQFIEIYKELYIIQ